MTQYQIRNMRTWQYYRIPRHNRRGALLNAIKRVTRFVRGLFTPYAIGFLILCALIGYASLGFWK